MNRESVKGGEWGRGGQYVYRETGGRQGKGGRGSSMRKTHKFLREQGGMGDHKRKEWETKTNKNGWVVFLGKKGSDGGTPGIRPGGVINGQKKKKIEHQTG